MAGAEVDVERLGEDLGCSTLEEQEADSSPIREQFACDRDGEAHRLYTFNSERSRNIWLSAADVLGYVIVEQGETWALVEGKT